MKRASLLCPALERHAEEVCGIVLGVDEGGGGGDRERRTVQRDGAVTMGEIQLQLKTIMRKYVDGIGDAWRWWRWWRRWELFHGYCCWWFKYSSIL